MLPSKYAPGGLSEADQRRTLTVGRRATKSSNYVVRVIEDRIEDHVRNPYSNGTFEMVPTDDYKEVSVISDYVRDNRRRALPRYEPQRAETPSLPDPVSPVHGRASYLVVDTNFMLSHLNILDELQALSEQYGLLIVIPMMVVQELDGLKNSGRFNDGPPIRSSKNSGRYTSASIDEKYGDKQSEGLLSSASVGHLARWANDWIYSALAERSPLVRGQKPSQRLDTTADKDDAILDCCLYFKASYPDTLQILLSNDKNLCLKALTNDVLTVSYRPEMSAKHIAEKIHEENIRRFGNVLQSGLQGSTQAVPQDVAQDVLQGVAQNNHQGVPQPFPAATPDPSHPPYPSVASQPIIPPSHTPQPSLTSHISQNTPSLAPLDITSHQIFLEIQDITLSVVHHCMKRVYGSDVDYLANYAEETVVSLRDCVQVMILFWTPVFSGIFKNGMPPFDNDQMSDSQSLFCDEPTSPSELGQFVEFWTHILAVLYEAEMDSHQNQALSILTRRWVTAATLLRV